MKRRQLAVDRPAGFWLVGLFVVAVGAFVRLWRIGAHPGWEWDEVVYSWIGRNLAQNGQLAFKPDYMATPEMYLYHPPFHFLLLAGWFKIIGSGVTQARLFAVVGAVAAMILIMALLRQQIGNRWALVGVAVIATDMWLIFSERIGWIENSMIPIGLLGLVLYAYAMKRGKDSLYALAGVVVALAASYKYTGIIFAGVIIVHFVLFERKKWRQHLIALGAAFAVIALYVVGSVLAFGPRFVRATVIQFARSVGQTASNGALTSLSSIVTPLLAQYKIYMSTVILATAAIVLMVVRAIQMIYHRSVESVRSISVLYAWAVTATLFFVALQLKFPHYSMLAFIPLFCYLTAEVSRLPMKWSIVRVLLIIVAAGILLANSLAFRARFVDVGHDSALHDVQVYAENAMPPSAKVIADESVAAVIPQPVCATWRGKNCVGATYIIVYTSATEQIENNNGQQDLINSGTLVFTTRGFKEEIKIYKLPHPI